MADERLQYLFDRFRLNQCSPAELQELSLLCLLPENQATLERLAESTWEQASLEQDMPEDAGEGILQRILHQSFPEPASEPVRVRRLGWRRIAVAASILLVLGTGGYLFFFNKAADQQQEPGEQLLAHDITAPVTNRATITLTNGQIIFLDSANSGTLATQGNVSVVKTGDGQIAYTTNSRLTADDSLQKESFGRLTYNTLTNPRGSKVIDMVLADGSHIWLNAGSSLTYPIAFTGNERNVSITGEAYFEVAHDAARPFHVSKGDMRVTVLGTHFNVNAYDDEPSIKVTLLEGSVKIDHRQSATGNDQSVRKNSSGAILKPGEQARLSEIRGSIRVIGDIDVEEVMAWKNGRFVFGEKTDIQTIMRQIARWYDVEVEYKGVITRHFGGSISRQVNISEVLKVLEASGVVKGQLEGKKVIVAPAP